MTAPAIEKRLWAPIRIDPREGRPDWPLYSLIRYTRREAKADYLAAMWPMSEREALKGIRFARVTIVEQSEETE